MKKKLLAVLLILALALTLVPGAFAATPEALAAAQTLYDRGLFKGVGTNPDGTPDFALDRVPTRHEAVTMLVRLLDKDAEALAGSWTTPFTDVADWAKPYVGYAYANGLTTGTGATTYSGGNTVDAAQYLTFVLRSLGYESGRDFFWNSPWTLSDEIGLTHGEYGVGRTAITRGDVAVISLAAISLPRITPVASVTLDRNVLELTAGSTGALVATVSPADATDTTVVWTSGNTQVATVAADGTITALAPGSSLITATCGGKAATCTVKVLPKPITYSGVGDKVISGVNIPAGNYYSEYSVNASCYFGAKLYYGSGNDYVTAVNDVGPCQGQKFLDRTRRTGVQDGILEVEASGSWTITFYPVSAASTTNLRGDGPAVTGIFTATKSRYVVSATQSGSGYFGAHAFPADDLSASSRLAVNTTDSSTQKVLELQPGVRYFLAVDADEGWTIDFGVGDALTTCGPTGGLGDTLTGNGYNPNYKDYDGHPGVPDLGDMFGVPTAFEPGPSSYHYLASKIYASGGTSALDFYVNALTDRGFHLGTAYEDRHSYTDGGMIFKNSDTGVTVSVAIVTSSGEQYVSILIY